MIYLFMTFIFMFMKHPLSMGMILLVQTILISLMTGIMSSSFWLSYILFLVMVGGMLILFMYMTNIASNKKFKFQTIILLYLPCFSWIFYIDINFLQNNNLINKMFNFPSMTIMLLLIIYLFITMVMAIKLTTYKLGPFRKI
uniref:NADH-ubiquinone oxidoreductase chain 6 n=1 Tax=Ptiliidae sp. BMNH 1274726 TaxID=1796538 RepID=A0A126TGE6_9COLE|nr:NADH dehydrogenase subunit 6 [Ptiliidae sp. BMNH 1274726]